MSDNTSNEPAADGPQSTGNIAIITNMFTSPSMAMTQVQERYNVIFPLFTFALLSALIMISYFAMVDYGWYIDYLVETTTGELSKSEQEQQRALLEMMSQTVMSSISAVTILIAVPVIYVIQAVYFLIVSNVNNDGYEFKQWLSFIAWTNMPSLLAIVAMFALLLTSANGQIPPDSLNPLSLNELIFGLEPSKGLGKLLSTIHLPQMLSFAVMIIGYQTWTKKSMATSAIIVLTPFVLFYVGWYLLFI